MSAQRLHAPGYAFQGFRSTSAAVSGEALTEQSDLSMLRPLHFDSSFAARPVMDDMDETKNFRALAVDDGESFLSGMEAPRGAQPEKTADRTADEVRRFNSF